MNPDGFVRIHPSRAFGTVQAPSSKSATHRAFLLAAQSTTPCTVMSPLRSADTNATLRALHQMGAKVQLPAAATGANGPHAPADDPARVTGSVRFEPAELRPSNAPLDCGNSGTTLRLLTATCARFPVASILDGDASLRARPSTALHDALRAAGAKVEAKDGKAPVRVQGPLRPGPFQLPPQVSSQFGSALLLSLPRLPGDSTLTLASPVSSSPYLDLTLESAAAANLRIQADASAAGRRFTIAGAQAPRASRLAVEGDWSAAAFPLVAAAITQGDVTVTGLRGDSKQGDRGIVQVIQAFGAKVSPTSEGARVVGASLSSPGTVDVSSTPDAFPALAVLAAASRGTTTFTGGAQLRAKESDRIRAMAEGLRALGIANKEAPDGLQVAGGTLRGGAVQSLGDHRVHMAFAVAALAAKGPVTIDDPACADVSYPGFHKDLAALGAKVDVASEVTA